MSEDQLQKWYSFFNAQTQDPETEGVSFEYFLKGIKTYTEALRTDKAIIEAQKATEEPGKAEEEPEKAEEVPAAIDFESAWGV